MRFSNEWWSYWAGVLAVALTAAAAITGLAAWYFANKASAEKDAATELKLEEVKKLHQPRMFSLAQMAPLKADLMEVPRGSLTVMYQPDDDEANALALILFTALNTEKNNWTIHGFPVPIPSNALKENLRKSDPRIRGLLPMTPFGRMGARSIHGIALIARTETDPTTIAVRDGFKRAGLTGSLMAN